eukprot:4656473-Pyramimonas_sp.AAC.1
MIFEKGREKLSASILSTFLLARSSTVFPAVTRSTVAPVKIGFENRFFSHLYWVMLRLPVKFLGPYYY